MDTKLDRRETSIGLGFTKVGIEDEVTETITIIPEIGHIAEIGIKTIKEEEETTATQKL